MLRSFTTLLLATLLSIYAAAEVQTWNIDPNHTAAQFSIRHLGISTVRGVFENTTGTVQYDSKDPAKTVVNATIDASTINTRVERRDTDLRSPNFFDVAKYPTITFKSKRTEAVAGGKLKVTGDLTMHGVTKEVVLDVDGPTAPVQDNGSTRMGTTAYTTINRRDFGVNGAAAVAGDDVKITLDIELKLASK